MDKYGSKFKCEHDECPYKDCNYHKKSTGKFSHSDKGMPIYLPKNEDRAKWCYRVLDL